MDMKIYHDECAEARDLIKRNPESAAEVMAARKTIIAAIRAALGIDDTHGTVAHEQLPELVEALVDERDGARDETKAYRAESVELAKYLASSDSDIPPKVLRVIESILVRDMGKR